MIKFTRAQLEARASERAPGYVAAVLALAGSEGDLITLTAEQAATLRADYTLPVPGPLELAANFTAAVARWTLAGLPVASEAIFLARRATCLSCPDYDAARRRCTLCGCSQSKLWLATEKCPADHWPAVTP